MEVGFPEPAWEALPLLLCFSTLSPFSRPPQSEHVQPCSQTWEPASLLLCLLLGLLLSALCPLSASASLLHDACSLTPPGVSGRENLWDIEPGGGRVEWLRDSKRAGPWPGEGMGGTAASLKPGQSQQVSGLVVKGWLLAVSESGALSGLSWLWTSASLPRPARALTPPCTL